MKNKLRKRFRIGTLFLIAMFLLIPLLSSPVSASFTQGLGAVWTNNWPPPPGAGPTAGGAIAAPASPVGDSAPFDIRFSVGYAFTDSYAGGSGSIHEVNITVMWQPGGAGPWSGPVSFVYTVYLAASGSATGVYTTSWITSYGGIGTKFRVTVIVSCEDISTMAKFTWTSGTIAFTI